MNGRRWMCDCDCGSKGNLINITALNHRAKTNGGCGSCQSRNKNNRPQHPLYTTYHGMKARCLNPKHASYANYGGRGIEVCSRWLNSFEDFVSDMGPRPSKDATIDRIDSNGNYEPSNCRWLSKAKQTANTRRCVPVEIDGVQYPTISEAATAYGLPESVVLRRVRTKGWSIADAVTTPIN